MIGIIGQGFVGNAVYQKFKNFYEVLTYDLDKENYRIVGKSNGRVFTFGDAVKVKVRDTNLAKRTIDLEMVGMRSGGGFANNRSRKRESPRGNRVIPKGSERRRNTGRR